MRANKALLSGLVVASLVVVPLSSASAAIFPIIPSLLGAIISGAVNAATAGPRGYYGGPQGYADYGPPRGYYPPPPVSYYPPPQVGYYPPPQPSYYPPHQYYAPSAHYYALPQYYGPPSNYYSQRPRHGYARGW